MASKSAETSRNFNPMSAPNLSDETRRAVNAAFDAMSTWRTETLSGSEKGFEQVMEKISEAARALGWPEQVVDATRSQVQSITKMQIQTIDQIMDAWEEQIKSPNPSLPILSKLKSFPSLLPVDAWSSAPQMAAMNPLQFTCSSQSNGRRRVPTLWRIGASDEHPKGHGLPRTAERSF